LKRRHRAQELATSGPGLAAGRAAIRLLGRTLRVTEVNWGVVERLWAEGGPVVYAVWHGRMLMIPARYASLRRFHVLASRSRDGELLSRFVRGFGVEAVRGSSSRGAGAALLTLARLLRREAAHVVVVPDGPRGPRFVAQAGAVLLAHLGHAPILPVGFGAWPRTEVGSWDRFVIPHPFARAAFVFGEPIRVEAGADRERLEAARLDLEGALRTLTREADRLAGAPRVPDL
jgi:lysophospholipid acyltransferase (LPLAT)-like uncharacterized protein